MKYLQKYYKFNEDVQIDTSNLQRLKDRFAPYLDDMSSKYNKDIEQIFNQEFIDNINSLCNSLDELGNKVSIRFTQYHPYDTESPGCTNLIPPQMRHGSTPTEIFPCCSIDIDSPGWLKSGYFIDNKVLEMTIKEIQSYVSDFGFDVDIEIGNDDQFVTADEFITTYNVEEFDFISIIIY